MDELYTNEPEEEISSDLDLPEEVKTDEEQAIDELPEEEADFMLDPEQMLIDQDQFVKDKIENLFPPVVPYDDADVVTPYQPGSLSPERVLSIQMQREQEEQEQAEHKELMDTQHPFRLNDWNMQEDLQRIGTTQAQQAKEGQVTDLLDPARVDDKNLKLNLKQGWDKAKEMLAWAGNNKIDAALASMMDVAVFAKELPRQTDAAFQEAISSIGNKGIRLANTLIERTPGLDIFGPIELLDKYSRPLIIGDTVIDPGGPFEPSSNIGAFMHYPIKLGMTTIAGLGAIGLAVGTIPVVTTKVASIAALGAVTAGSAMLLAEPEDPLIGDIIYSNPIFPAFGKMIPEFMRSNGDSYALQTLKTGVETFVLEFLGGLLIKGGYKASSAMRKRWAKKYAEVVGEAADIHKKRSDFKDVVEASYRVLPDDEDALRDNYVMNSFRALPEPDEGSQVIKSWDTSRLPPTDKTIPQFRLQDVDPFVPESSPTSQMARVLPPDRRNKSLGMIGDLKNDLSVFHQANPEAGKMLGGWEILEGMLTSQLTEIDEYLSSPDKPVIKPTKQTGKMGAKVHDADDESLEGFVFETPMDYTGEVGLNKVPPKGQEAPIFNPLLKLDYILLELGRVSSLKSFDALSEQGKIKYQNIFDKFTRQIEKNYYSSIEKEDLVFPMDFPKIREGVVEIRKNAVAHEESFGRLLPEYKKVLEALKEWSVSPEEAKKKGFKTWPEMADDLRKLEEPGLQGVITVKAFIDTVSKILSQQDPVDVTQKVVPLKKPTRQLAPDEYLALTKILLKMEQFLSYRRKLLDTLFDLPFEPRAVDLEGVVAKELTLEDAIGSGVGLENAVPIVTSANLLRELKDVDTIGLLDGTTINQLYDGWKHREDMLSEMAVARYKKQRVLERAKRGKEYLKHDFIVKKSEELVGEQKAAYEAEIARQREVIEMGSRAVVQLEKDRKKAQEDYNKVASKAKEVIKTKDEKAKKRILREQGRTEKKLKEKNKELKNVKKDLELAQTQIKVFSKRTPWLIDKEMELPPKEQKFVFVKKGKVFANINKFKGKEDWAEAVVEVKKHMRQHLKKEDRLYAEILKSGWERGEVLPTEIRQDVAKKLGMTDDQFALLSPFNGRQGMGPFKYTPQKRPVLPGTLSFTDGIGVLRPWNAEDLVASMKIMEASVDRVTLLAKLAVEKDALTKEDLEILNYTKEDVANLEPDNVEALTHFKDSFETLFYTIYPQVFTMLHHTPMILPHAKKIDNRLTYLGQIEDTIKRFGNRGFPDNLDGLKTIAQEWNILHKKGGTALSDMRKNLHLMRYDRGNIITKFLNSAMFLRTASMLSSTTTMAKILSSGIIETSLKLGMEYPLEALVFRPMAQQGSVQSGMNQLLKMWGVGTVAAFRASISALASHFEDLSKIASWETHRRRDFSFTRSKIDPSGSHMDQGVERMGDEFLVRDRHQPTRYKPDELSVFGAISDMFTAFNELPHRGIDMQDDVFKSINGAFRMQMLAVRAADADVPAEINRIREAAMKAHDPGPTKFVQKKWFDPETETYTHVHPEYRKKARIRDHKVEEAIWAFEDSVDDYWARRYQYHLENPSPEMAEDVLRHQRQVVLTEDLKENGWLRNVYENWYGMASGFRYLWPFLRTSLNSYKNNVERGPFRLAPELMHLTFGDKPWGEIVPTGFERGNKVINWLINLVSLSKDPKMYRMFEEMRDKFPEGSPERKAWEDAIGKHTPQTNMKYSMLRHSIFDQKSDPNAWAQEMSRFTTGMMLGFAGIYLASEGFITGHDDVERNTPYDLGRKSVGWIPGAVFWPISADGKRGIYIQVKRDEPLGLFLTHMAEVHEMGRYMYAQDYEELVHTSLWMLGNVFAPEIVKDVFKDVEFYMSMQEGKFKAAHKQFWSTVKTKIEPLSPTPLVDLPKEFEGLVPDIYKTRKGDQMVKPDPTIPSPFIGLKGLVIDFRNFIKSEKEAFEPAEDVQRDYTVSTVTEYQDEQGRWRQDETDMLSADIMFDMLVKMYSKKAKGYAENVATKRNLWDEPMPTTHKYGMWSIGAYLLPNAVAKHLVRPELEGGLAPKIIREWERIDYDLVGNKYIGPTKEADEKLNASVFEAFQSRGDMTKARIHAEFIRLGVQHTWAAAIKDEQGWNTRPIFDRIAKHYGKRNITMALTAQQRADLIKETNTISNTEELVKKYGGVKMVDALYNEITNHYPSLGDDEEGRGSFDKFMRQEKIKEIIGDYAEEARKKYVGLNPHIEAAMRDKSEQADME